MSNLLRLIQNSEMNDQIYQYLLERIVTINVYLANDDCDGISVLEKTKQAAMRDELICICVKFYRGERNKLLQLRKMYAISNAANNAANNAIQDNSSAILNSQT